jgi:hypothetical protein
LGADSLNGESSLTYAWSVTSPSGALAPTFSSNCTNGCKNTTVTFHQAGPYTFTVKETDKVDGNWAVSASLPVSVGQSLAGISISPPTVALTLGTQQQLTVSGKDQFGQTAAIANGAATWSTTIGSFSGGNTLATVTYVAPGASGQGTITVKDGSMTATAAVSIVAAAFPGLQDQALAVLVASENADNSISRTDMITTLQTVETYNGGVLSSTDFNDLQQILKDATGTKPTLNMPGYVQVLAGDVINGNPANATYLGLSLGNLVVGSSGAKLDKLIDKWFYGTDLPSPTLVEYGLYPTYDTSTAGSLFGPSGP